MYRPISQPKITDFYEVIRKMKDNRAPEEDDISSELIKKGGRPLWTSIYELIISI